MKFHSRLLRYRGKLENELFRKPEQSNVSGVTCEAAVAQCCQVEAAAVRKQAEDERLCTFIHIMDRV